MAQALPFVHKLQKMIENYDDLTTDGSHILCTTCNRRYLFHTRRDCGRHLNSHMHLQNAGTVTKKENIHDLCVMFCACSLSWQVVDNAEFRSFFAKYIPGFPLPSSDTLRKTYLPSVYKNVLGNIISDVQNKFLWVTVDETDFQCNKVVNVILRILSVQKVLSPILIASKRVQQTTAHTVEEIVTSALSSISVQNNNVLMLVTDATTYMVKAGEHLKHMYPNMIHITCLAQSLHSVAEEISKQYPVVDSLIRNTKNVFVKASLRKQFKERFPNIPLPPRPVPTRCCTWIQAVIYYVTNFENVKTFILQLDPSDSRATSRSQWAFQQPNIYSDLCDIVEHFEILIAATTKLESGSLRFLESLSMINDVQNKLAKLSDSKSRTINNKLKNVLHSNLGYKTMCKIRENYQRGLSVPVVPAHIKYLEFAPLTSIDVEGSFSLYKHMYTPYRLNLTATNAERILVVTMYANAMTDLSHSR